MTKLSTEEIVAIRERVEKATGGKWYYEIDGDLYSERTRERVLYPYLTAETIPLIKVSKDDANFIAHARTDIPKLLAEIERMRAGIMYTMQETYCDDTRDFLRRLLIGEEKTELPYRMGHGYGGDSE